MATAADYGLVGYDPVGEQEAGVRLCSECWCTYAPNAASYLSSVTASARRKGVSAKTLNMRCGWVLVSSFRMLLFKLNSNKSPVRCIHVFDIVSMQDLEDIIGDTVEFGIRRSSTDSRVSYICIQTTQIWKVVALLRTSLRDINGNCPENDYLNVKMKPGVAAPTTPFGLNPAEIITLRHIANCNYKQIPISEEFIAYVQRLYSSRVHVFDLFGCPGADRDSKLAFDGSHILQSFERDTHFNNMQLDEVLHKGLLNSVGSLLPRNSTITKLSLKYSQASVDQSIISLGVGLISSSIQVLTLSGVHFEGGLNAWSTFCCGLERLQHGFISLDLSRCDLSGKHIALLFNAFERNWPMSLSLSHLNLCGNKFEEQGSLAFSSWATTAGEHSHLRSLMLGHSSLSLMTAAPGLIALSRLVQVDLSGARIEAARDIKEPTSVLLKQFLESCRLIRQVTLQDCQFSIDCLELSLFYPILNNHSLSDVSVDISSNNLSFEGSIALSRACPTLSNIAHLNIENNRLRGKGVIDVLGAMAKNTTLKSLFIGNNTDSDKDAKELVTVFVDFLKSHPTVCAIGFGNKRVDLSRYISMLLQHFASSKSLTYADVSGHSFGDQGASILGHALCRNQSITELDFDGNGITPTGWMALSMHVQENDTLQHISQNTLDLALCYSILSHSPQHLKSQFNQSMFNFHKKLDANSSVNHTPRFSVFFDTFPDIEAPSSMTPLVEVPQSIINKKAVARLSVPDEEAVIEGSKAKSATLRSPTSTPTSPSTTPSRAPSPPTITMVPMTLTRSTTPPARASPPLSPAYLPSLPPRDTDYQVPILPLPTGTPPSLPPRGGDRDRDNSSAASACSPLPPPHLLPSYGGGWTGTASILISSPASSPPPPLSLTPPDELPSQIGPPPPPPPPGAPPALPPRL
ncbi:F-actin-uncapping protein LRRC16A [Pelomyxa schiedti]|nr:F-actin-uncapping protein LRRC16A [Pelomyxa schiedti]